MGYAHFFVTKANPNHDKLGRFATAPGAGGASIPTTADGDYAMPDYARYNDANLAKLAANYQTDSRLGEAGYQAFADKARTLLDHADIYRWSNAANIDKILDSGRLKSQFETGTSDGMLNPFFRRQVEKQLFGYDEHATPADHRPIYGFMADPNNLEKDAFGASSYGEAILHFKPEVRDRTTVTGGDSLSLEFYPTSLKDLNPAGLLPSDRTAIVSQQVKSLPEQPTIKDFHDKLLVNYIEAQMHGGVKASDIDAVYDPHGKIGPATQAKLKAHGIQYIPGWKAGDTAKPAGAALMELRDKLRAARGLPPFAETVKAEGYARLFAVKFDQWHDKLGRFATRDGGMDMAGSDLKQALYDMRHAPDEHPNIMRLRVDGKPVFGTRNLGIARADMPQIPSKERDAFLHGLHVPVTLTELDPTTLIPIQDQLDGYKVSQVYHDLRHHNERVDKPILVSQDHYIIDGHHHWGGKMLEALHDPSTKIKAYVVHMDHQPLLAAAHQFDIAHGIHGKDITKMEGYARFFVTKFNPNHGKDGRFTGKDGAATITERDGGAEFMSPQEGSGLDLSQAIAEIRRDPHVKFREFSDKVDRALGITSSEQHDALGDWNTGAENAVFDRVHGNVDFDTIKAATAIKGLVANQMMVIPFKAEPGGPDSLYRFEVKDDINNVRQVLNEHGIDNRTLIPRPDGSIGVVLYDQGTQLRDNVKGVAQHYGTPIRLSRGKGELFGSFDDREQGKAAYRQFLDGFVAHRPDLGRTIRDLLHGYRSGQAGQAQKSEYGLARFFGGKVQPQVAA